MGCKDGLGKGIFGDVYLLELCGGIYVMQLGEIGVFVVLVDSVFFVGVCCVEVLIGQVVIDYFKEQQDCLLVVVLVLKVLINEVVDCVKVLFDECKVLVNEVVQFCKEFVMFGGVKGEEFVKEINGMLFKVQVLLGVIGKDLLVIFDDMKGQIGSGIIFLIVDIGGKVVVVVGVIVDLMDCVLVVDIVCVVMFELGGKGGGGCFDMVQGGGVFVDNVEVVIKVVEVIVEGV